MFAVTAATGALQHLAYTSIQASAARSHSEQRGTTSITAARSCGLLFYTGYFTQASCSSHYTSPVIIFHCRPKFFDHPIL